jgi:hypothetical protein
MNKILTVSVLLGVTAMMIGSILPAMAFETNDHCKPGTEGCHDNGPPKKGDKCDKIRDALEKANTPKGVAERILLASGCDTNEIPRG